MMMMCCFEKSVIYMWQMITQWRLWYWLVDMGLACGHWHSAGQSLLLSLPTSPWWCIRLKLLSRCVLCVSI